MGRLRGTVQKTKGRRTANARGEVRAVDPLMRELFDLVELQDISLNAFAMRAGYSRKSLHDWRSGRCQVYLQTIVDLAHVAGYELVLRPKQE